MIEDYLEEEGVLVEMRRRAPEQMIRVKGEVDMIINHPVSILLSI